MNVPNHDKVAFKDMTPEERSAIVEGWLSNNIEYYSHDLDGWQEKGNSGLYSSTVYRTRQRKLEIPWEHIKREIKFAFVGKSGQVYGCEYKPILGDRFYEGWKSDDKWYRIDECIDIDTTGIDWSESLTARPDGV